MLASIYSGLKSLTPKAIVPLVVIGEPLSTSIPSLPLTATLVTVPLLKLGRLSKSL